MMTIGLPLVSTPSGEIAGRLEHVFQAFDLNVFLDRIGQDLESLASVTDFSALIIDLVAGIALGALVYLALTMVRRLVRRRVEAMKTAAPRERDNGRAMVAALGSMIAATSSLFLLVTAFAAGSYTLSLVPVVRGAITSLFIISFVLQAAVWASVALTASLDSYARRHGDRRAARGATSIIGLMARAALWSIALLLILDNLGFDVTALMAGLGIGGIAIGLAAQNILGDLFASLSIVLDKPFEIDDFIISDNYMGTVERIGLKTTRLRSLSGEQVVISNADLLSSRIRNYKRMAERRVLFTLGVVYGTPFDKLEKVPHIVRTVIEAQERTRFDRCHFVTYGDFSLNFETAYYVLSADYNEHMDTLQAINFAIYRHFAEEGLEFAYPTQSIHVASMPMRLSAPREA